MSDHEVKGVWFASGRAFLLDAYDEETCERLVQAMGEWGHVLASPDHGAWYPEDALQTMLRAIDDVLAHGDETTFVDLMRRSTHHGIGKFFRVLMKLGSAGFVLRKVPVMWNRIRRGPGVVEVDARPDRSIVHYREFPYFGDVRYRWLTQGSLQGLVETATGEIPQTRVLGWGPKMLDIEVEHP